jgi:hypothetical protein
MRQGAVFLAVNTGSREAQMGVVGGRIRGFGLGTNVSNALEVTRVVLIGI